MANLTAQSRVERRPAVSRSRTEHGIAILIAMMALVLMSGLGLALVAAASSESLIAANFRAATEVFYAADAMAGRALVDLRSAGDLTEVLTGAAPSSFVDGAPAGTRVLGDSAQIDLGVIVNLANCGRTTACSASAMDAVTAERPWGLNNPRWSLYAYGRVNGISGGGPAGAGTYVVAMVADDPSELDGNPLRDALPGEPGSGVLTLRIIAFGPRGARKTVEITLLCRPALRLLSWHS